MMLHRFSCYESKLQGQFTTTGLRWVCNMKVADIFGVGTYIYAGHMCVFSHGCLNWNTPPSLELPLEPPSCFNQYPQTEILKACTVEYRHDLEGNGKRTAKE